MTDDTEDTIESIAKREVEASWQRHQAARATPPPPPTEAELRAELELREAIRETVLAHGALPRASRFVVRDALALFERAPDGALVSKAGLSEPGNPLRPLTLHAWLLQLSEEEPYLFEPRRRQ